jgi:predicted enzyme related to lactoylglutathione lyase/quinol monooxygenase YgiN
VTSPQLSLTSSWYIAPGKEALVLAALQQLAKDVYAAEPDTLTYLIHTPFPGDGSSIQSRPPVTAHSVLFFEVYRNPEAFLSHVNGPVFTKFVAQHGSLFVSSHGSPFSTVEFLTQLAGFTRTESPSGTDVPDNRHPAVMFEIIANDQPSLKSFYSKVFGWQYQTGAAGFAYVHFPERTPPLLGGIGQADPSVPGFEPGHSFYILVEDLENAIERAIAAGGSRHMDPATADGYHFAMIKDPEGNAVGLILPFQH